MNKYHYILHDGREGHILADDVQLVNSDTTGLDNSLFPVLSWVFYRGGEKWMEMPAWMIHGEPKLLPETPAKDDRDSQLFAGEKERE